MSALKGFKEKNFSGNNLRLFQRFKNYLNEEEVLAQKNMISNAFERLEQFNRDTLVYREPVDPALEKISILDTCIDFVINPDPQSPEETEESKKSEESKKLETFKIEIEKEINGLKRACNTNIVNSYHKLPNVKKKVKTIYDGFTKDETEKISYEILVDLYEAKINILLLQHDRAVNNKNQYTKNYHQTLDVCTYRPLYKIFNNLKNPDKPLSEHLKQLFEFIKNLLTLKNRKDIAEESANKTPNMQAK